MNEKHDSGASLDLHKDIFGSLSIPPQEFDALVRDAARISLNSHLEKVIYVLGKQQPPLSRPRL
jgi:hypothetical protein